MEKPVLLRLFGGVSFCSGYAARLLARLALAGAAGCSRDDLIAGFWPDESPKVARPRLRQALLTLGRALEQAGIPADSLLADQDTLRLNGAVLSTDIAAFEAALMAGDWAQAETLYSGDLMPQIEDSVVAGERSRLRLAYQNVLRDRAEAFERAGDPVQAAACAERLAALDRLDENYGLLLLRLLVASGQVKAARREYRKLRRHWQTERGESLPTQTRRQVRQLFANAALPQKTAPTATRFFGRESERESVRALLRDENCRLLTLIGPGGAGKTRLAVESAREDAAQITEGAAVFVSLADIADAALVGDKILGALRLSRDATVTPLTQAVRTLAERERPPLLILDNAEHLLEQDELRDAVQTLLAGAPALRILATSRQPLEIAGEREFPVAPLPVPDAVALFTDRLQAAQPEFRLTPENESDVAEICRRLDGLPLALEIAATWAKTLSPAEMRALVGQTEQPLQRAAFLVDGHADDSTTPRHASLHAAIAWSHRLLSPETQRFFCRLHIFRGGFTDEAAAAVCGESEALETLATLQERSLVQGITPTGSGDETGIRFRLLETLREFGRDQLSADERAELARRHAAYYAELTEQAEPEMLRPDQARWGARIEAETDNFRAALQWALSPDGDPSLGLRQAGARWRSWPLFVHLSEARGYLERLLALIPPDNTAAIPGQTKAVFALGVVAFYQGDSAEGIRRADECRQLSHLPEDAWVVAFNQSWLGVMKFYAGRFDESAADLAEGLELSRTVGDDWLVGYTLAFNGFLALCRGELASVPTFCDEAVIRAERVGEKWLGALNALILAQYHFYVRGDAAGANALSEKGMTVFRELNDLWCLSFAQSLHGFLLQRQNRTDEARQIHEENLRAGRAAGASLHIACSLEGIAEAASSVSQHEQAATLWGASDVLHEQIGIPVWPFLRPFRETAIIETRFALDPATFTAATERGKVLPMDEVVRLAAQPS